LELKELVWRLTAATEVSVNFFTFLLKLVCHPHVITVNNAMKILVRAVLVRGLKFGNELVILEQMLTYNFA
jgi:hypothetical protein